MRWQTPVLSVRMTIRLKNQSDEEILTLLTCVNRGTKRFVCRCVPAVKEGEADED